MPLAVVKNMNCDAGVSKNEPRSVKSPGRGCTEEEGQTAGGSVSGEREYVVFTVRYF
jgi:hypothetical protein